MALLNKGYMPQTYGTYAQWKPLAAFSLCLCTTQKCLLSVQMLATKLEVLAQIEERGIRD